MYALCTHTRTHTHSKQTSCILLYSYMPTFYVHKIDAGSCTRIRNLFRYTRQWVVVSSRHLSGSFILHAPTTVLYVSARHRPICTADTRTTHMYRTLILRSGERRDMRPNKQLKHRYGQTPAIKDVRYRFP